MYALNRDRSFPAWGDMGNGYYKNPVLNADYSDPDLIRVGADFYMVCSDFHYMGIPVLHSTDLVNWTIISQVYRRLDIDTRYDTMDAYGKGSWAPAIRFYKGRFYVYFCTPDEGLYMTAAENPAGPWSPLHEVRRVYGWEDPCPFWDDDGQAYLGHSILGAGPIIIHKMSPDGRSLLDDGRIVYIGKIAEGTKIYKRNGWYYLVIPEGGVEKGWQTVARSRDIYGPYERKVVLSTGRGIVNGPHQGGLVELESGESWFMHFQSAGAIGRVCHLQPVRWVDDWPLMGAEGEPVSLFSKPDTGAQYERLLPQGSDSFGEPLLGPQWQWNHNPVDTAWSLDARPGFLRLNGLPADGLKTARNTLTQKIMGLRGQATIRLEYDGLSEAQQAGLCLLGGGTGENRISVTKHERAVRIEAQCSDLVFHGPVLSAAGPDRNGGPGCVYLRVDLDLESSTRFSFSLDGVHFMGLGGNCELSAGYWKGVRIGVYCYEASGTVSGTPETGSAPPGYADFSDFVYLHDGMVSHDT